MKKLLKKIPQRIYFVFLPLFLFFVCLGLFLTLYLFRTWISQNTIFALPFSASPEAKMPIIKTEFVPVISATGAIIMDADSKVVLYAKNPNIKSSTASTAKIMTALTALDYFKPMDILTVKEATSDGSVLGLLQNEKM